MGAVLVQVLGAAMIVLCGYGVYWLYKNLHKVNRVYLVVINNPGFTLNDAQKNALGQIGKWSRVSDTHFRVTTQLQPEKLEEQILKICPAVSRKQLVIADSASNFAGSLSF